MTTSDPVHWKFKRNRRATAIDLCSAKRRAVRASDAIVLRPTLKNVIGAGYGDAHEATFAECPACKRIGEALLMETS